MGETYTVWTPDRVSDLSRLAATQLTSAAIGTLMGMSAGSIQTAMCKLGLRQNLTLLQRERITELFVDEGWTSFRRIAMRVGQDVVVVTRVLSEAGLLPFVDPGEIVLRAPPLRSPEELSVRKSNSATAEEIEIVKSGIREGLTQRAISERHPEITRHRIYKIVRDLNLRPKRSRAVRGTLRRQHMELRRLVDAGLTQVAISERLGVSQGAVSSAIREMREAA